MLKVGSNILNWSGINFLLATLILPALSFSTQTPQFWRWCLKN